MTKPVDDHGLPDELAPPDAATLSQLVLSPTERKQYLGRLADFEMKLAGLPDMQANFVLAVLADPTDYTKAARSVGYKHPNIQSARLSKLPHIAACIAAGEQLREDRTFLTSERTMHEFAIIAFSDIRDYAVGPRGRLELAEGVPEYAARAVKTVKWDVTTWVDDEGTEHTRTKTEVQLWSKLDALKMIAMYQKLLSGDGGANLLVDQSKHVHLHQHQHNTWQWGDDKITF